MKHGFYKLQKRHFLFAITVIVALYIICVFIMDLPDISRAKFKEIQLGMTEKEVTTILGRSPGKPFVESDYLSDIVEVWGAEFPCDLSNAKKMSMTWRIWWGRDFAVKVHFNAKGNVVGARYRVVKHEDDSIILYLRRIAGL